MDKYAQMEKNTVAAKKQLADGKTVFFTNPHGRGIRVLFAGNSMTLHGVKDEIGWHHCWGMAASAKENDYVHRLMRSIRTIDEDAAFCICQVADWECQYKAGSELLETFEPARRFGADIIIVRFIENCPKDDFAPDVFYSELTKLLQYLDGTGRAAMILTTGFWRHPGDDSIRKLAREKGWPVVELGDLGEDERMKAVGLFWHKGVANHPGDEGMAHIAKRIFKALPLDRYPIFHSVSNAG